MLVLTLPSALCAPALHVAVGVAVPSLPIGVGSSGPAARVELGAGTPSLQGYAVAQVGVQDVGDLYDEEGKRPAGDFVMADLGVGARRPFAWRRLRVIPHLELGVVLFETPYKWNDYDLGGADDPDVYPLHSVGAWAQTGCDVGFAMLDDVLTASVGFDIGYATNPGIGLVVGPRFGVSALF